MYCEAGPVKIRSDARAVPDLDPGPLAREPRQQPPTGSEPLHRNSLFFKGYQAMVYATMLGFTPGAISSGFCLAGVQNQGLPGLGFLTHRDTLMALQVMQGFDIDITAMLHDLAGAWTLVPAVFKHQPATIDQYGSGQ